MSGFAKLFFAVSIIVLAILIWSKCSNSANQQAIVVQPDKQAPVVKIDNPDIATLTNFSKEDVARYAISSIMGQPAKKIKVRSENDIYYVSYVRKSDSKKFDYKIMIVGQSILWANIDGRWRDSEYDEKISFEERNNTLKIIQTFSDGSIDSKEFQKGQ